jgi:hypothetical protein
VYNTALPNEFNKPIGTLLWIALTEQDGEFFRRAWPTIFTSALWLRSWSKCLQRW